MIAAGTDGGQQSTPCATWVLGWTCGNRVSGIDGSRACPNCTPKLPPPPYGEHATLAAAVWAAERVKRDALHPTPTDWLAPKPAPAAAPTKKRKR